VKLPAHRAGLPGHASGEQDVSKGSFVYIVPLDPAYKAGSRGTFRPNDKILMSIQNQSANLENIRISGFDMY